MDMERQEDVRQHSVSQQRKDLSRSAINEIIKLRNISFGNIDFEILKAAMLASKCTMLKGDDVTTEKMPGKMLPGGGNNAKANEWSFYG